VEVLAISEEEQSIAGVAEVWMAGGKFCHTAAVMFRLVGLGA